MNLLLLKRNAIRLLRLRPEVGDREAPVEVRAVVVHDRDGEHNVHAELYQLVPLMECGRDEKGRGGGLRAGTYFEDFEIGAAHFECLWQRSVRFIGRCVEFEDKVIER